MEQWISNFNTTAEFAAFSGTSECLIPHVSLTNDNDKVHFISPYKSRAYVEIVGLKWATMNIGAKTITDVGLFFQWGDTKGYAADQIGSEIGQKRFYWADYKYGNGTTSPGTTGMTKYNSTDGKTVLDASDDAAAVNWGGVWRMPTTDEYVSLGNSTTSAWTTDYQGSGVAGLILTSRSDSSKKLFFPAAGRCYAGVVREVGTNGYLWSSSISNNDVTQARVKNFLSSGGGWQAVYYRYNGFSIRAVAD